MSRNYYTYAEIILSLRNNYQEVQKKLNKMKEQMLVATDKSANSNLFLRLKEIDNETKEVVSEPSVHLHVSKVCPSHVKNIINGYIYKGNNGADKTILYHTNNADFIMNDDFSFTQELYGNLKLFAPGVVVPEENKEYFEKYYQQLQQLPLYNTPSLEVELSPFQWFVLRGNRMELFSGYTDSVTIKYVASDDKIHIFTKEEQSSLFIEDLFATKIPSYELGDEVLNLFKYNEYTIDNVSIDPRDSICNKDRFTIMDKEPELILKKVVKK